MDHSTSELSIRDKTVCQEMLPVFYRRELGNSFKKLHIHFPVGPTLPILGLIPRKNCLSETTHVWDFHCDKLRKTNEQFYYLALAD